MRPHTPWFPRNITAATKEHLQAKRRWSSTKLLVHLDLLREVQRKVNRLCKVAKSVYYQSEIASSNELKKLFNLTFQHDQNQSSPSTERKLKGIVL